MSGDSAHTMAERIDRQRIERDSQPPLCEASVNAGLHHKLEKEFSILPDNNLSGIANHLTQHERLSPAGLETLNTLLSHITPCRVVLVLIVMRLLGMMSASHVVAPFSLLHMRIQVVWTPLPQPRSAQEAFHQLVAGLQIASWFF